MKMRGYFCSDACKAAYLSSKPAAQLEREKLSDEQLSQCARQGDLMAAWLFKRVPLLALALALSAAALSFLDKSGAEQWVARPPGGTSFVESVPSGDSVFARCSDGLCLSFSCATGAERWRSPAPSAAPSDAAWDNGLFSPDSTGLEVGDGLVLRSLDRSCSVALAETGETLWARSTGGFERKPAALSNGRVLLAVDLGADRSDGDGGAGPAGAERALRPRLVCADARSGKELWSRTFDGREIKAAEAAGDVGLCLTCIPPRAEWRPCARHPVTNVKERAACPACGSGVTQASSYEMNAIRMTDGAPLWSGQMTSGSLDQMRLFDNRIAVVAGTHLYVLSLGGEKTAHSRLPRDTRKVCLGGDYVAAATAGGLIVVFSTRTGALAWERKIGGQAWSLDIVADSLYVTAGIPREDADRLPDGTPKAPAPRTAQQQLLEEMRSQLKDGDPGGEGDDGLGSRPEHRTLVNYRLADGKERWRRQPLVGELHVLADGNCLLLAQGSGTQALFQSGGGSCLTEHLQRNGKELWKYESADAIFSVKAGADSVCLLTGSSRAASGSNSGTLRTVRRRTLLNKVRKF